MNGSAIYTYEITRALAKLGNQVTLVVPRQPQLEVVPNVLIRPVRTIESRFLGFPSYALGARANMSEYDIIHSQSGAGVFAPRVDIQTIHHFPWVRDELVDGISTILLSRRVKSVITVSEHSKDYLVRQKGFDEAKVHVIHNGISPDFLTALSTSAGSNYPFDLEKNAFVALHVNTTLSKRKNLRLALLTIKKMVRVVQTAVLVVVGPSWGKEFVMDAAAIEGVLGNIKYVSNLTTQALARLFLRANVLLLPSIEEGFGIPMVEAVAAGIPFISFNVGVAMELATHRYGTVVKSPDEFITAALATISGALGPGPGGLRFINENFSWSNAANELEKVYRGLPPA
jgi:glycosyltransferase involved in cell wall biosynthesis